MSGPDDIAGLLERYRGEGRRERGYPDLHDHVLALHRAGLLIVVDEPINKDTEMHPLVRWQYRSWSPVSPPIRKSTASALTARLMRSGPRG